MCLSMTIFICPESTKTQYVNHVQRTGQLDHNGTEHCPKYTKYDKNTIISDQTVCGQLGD